VPFDAVDDRRQQVRRLAVAPAFGRDIAVVEGEEGHAQLLEELEGRVELRLGRRERLLTAVVPGAIERPHAEHVRPWPGEGVPQADRDAKVVLHPLAQHESVRLVHLVGQGILGAQTRERDRSGHGLEERLAHPSPSAVLSMIGSLPSMIVQEKHKLVDPVSRSRDDATLRT
jgi:hypothetical protein